MFLFRLVFIIVSLAFMTVTAIAEDPSENKWSGFYFGLGGGYGKLYGDVDVLIIDSFDRGETVDTDVGYLSGTIGYDQQINKKFLIGVFAEFDASNIEDPSLKQWSVGGRLGYLATEDLLLFVSGGYTRAKVRDMLFEELGYSELDWITDNNKIKFPDYEGWFLGAGGEYMFNNGLSIRGEYRYSQFDRQRLNLPEVSAAWGFVRIDADDVVNASAEGDTHTFRATVNYKF